MSVLVPCTSCSRHVRAAESTCPFCGHDLPANLASRAVPSPSPTRRLDRLATFTFAVGLTVAACGGVTGGDGDDRQDQTESEDELRKKKKDAGTNARADGGCVEDTGGFAALYGMPPFTPPPPPPCETDAGASRDAGRTDAGRARDAGRVRDSGGIHAMYGAPFTPDDEDGGGFHALYGMPPVP